MSVDDDMLHSTLVRYYSTQVNNAKPIRCNDIITKKTTNNYPYYIACV
ncbi:MAG: hypothetical protein [Betabaculovirus sp.]|nr:MAG: hypothetical protein [Betabaculovirus sp.]